MNASRPFEFVTASYLIRVSGREAGTLAELQHGIESCSDASIFYHTFQSLGRHHFLNEGFSNDFAQWVLGSCNRPALAEQLASLDIRDYVSVSELRTDLVGILAGHSDAEPHQAAQHAFEKFYFCETIEEEVPLGAAPTLEEFRDRLTELPHASLQFHFLTSRLRLHLRTNDFSLWFSDVLGLQPLARSVDRIDIYTNTLDSARDRIVALVDREISR
ncbi:MAG TPA: DUF5752 family protein [Candidatus Acidoferrales bacterium]|nr:DUF5752 family protein [Candidatus Acidoferrales bacterium]